MEPDTTKGIILQAAVHVLQTVGAGKLTLEKVAEAAGVSKGGLLYHFPSKKALLAGLVQAGLEEFEQAIESRVAGGMRWLDAYIDASLASGAQDAWSSALLGPLFEDASLLEPVRVAMTAWYAKAFADEGARGHLILMALDGLYFQQLTGIDTGVDFEGLTALLQDLSGGRWGDKK